MSVPSTGYVESPVFFEADGETLFGIVSAPTGDGSPRTGFIILPGGGTPLTTSRNRISVRICREIAARGLLALRCDYHGTGESTGAVDVFRLDRPFVADVAAAVSCLRDLGVERVIVAGSCFGGRTALAAAADIPGVTGVMLIATSPRDYVMGERASANRAVSWSLPRYLRESLRPRTLKGLFDRRMRGAYVRFAWAKLTLIASKVPGVRRYLPDRPIGADVVSSAFRDHLDRAVRRRVKVTLLYGVEDHFWDEFREAAAGPLEPILADTEDLVEIRTIPGKLHGFTSLAIQDAAFDEIVAWACAHAAPPTAVEAVSRSGGAS